MLIRWLVTIAEVRSNQNSNLREHLAPLSGMPEPRTQSNAEMRSVRDNQQPIAEVENVSNLALAIGVRRPKAV